jgi:hypothetical protein
MLVNMSNPTQHKMFSMLQKHFIRIFSLIRNGLGRRLPQLQFRDSLDILPAQLRATEKMDQIAIAKQGGLHIGMEGFGCHGVETEYFWELVGVEEHAFVALLAFEVVQHQGEARVCDCPTDLPAIRDPNPIEIPKIHPLLVREDSHPAILPSPDQTFRHSLMDQQSLRHSQIQLLETVNVLHLLY